MSTNPNSTLWPVYAPDTRNGVAIDDRTQPVAVVKFAPTDRIETGQMHTIGSSTPALILGGNPNRRVTTLRNEGSVDLYIGHQQVTVTSGFRLGVGQSLTLETGGDIWAITPSGTGVIHWLAELEARR